MPCHSWCFCQRALLVASYILPLAGSFCPYTSSASSRISSGTPSRQLATPNNVRGEYHPISQHARFDEMTLRRRRARVTGDNWYQRQKTSVRTGLMSMTQQGWGESDDRGPINGEQRGYTPLPEDERFPAPAPAPIPAPSSEWREPRKYDDGWGEGIPRLNTVFLTGYLGQDPKPKYFDSGKVVLNLSLAVKREYHPLERKAFGIVSGQEETDWFQLEMWNRDAEYAASICRKGARIGVQGSLAISEWTDREGNPRTTNKILVQNLELLDSKAEMAMRSDKSDANLWESERLEKASAAAKMRNSQEDANPQDAAQQARKKEAEDKWWSAKPESEVGAGGVTSTGGGGGGTSWWDEDSGGAGAGGGISKGIEPDALPSFFDDQ